MPNRTKQTRDEIDSLFHLTLRLHHLNKDVERRFKLSLVQLFVLLRIRTLPATSSQALSSAIGIQPSSLTQTIRRLERKEYVFVTDDPRDSRKKLISLTRRGKDTVDVVYGDLKSMFGRLEGKVKNNLDESLDYLDKVQSELNGRLDAQ